MADTDVEQLLTEAQAWKSEALRARKSADEIKRQTEEIHRRMADLHARAAEFLTNLAVLDRIAGRVELALEMEARAERERDLEVAQRQLAAGESIRSPR